MAKAVPIHKALLEHTISMLAREGLENISLRTIAARAGCTTAVIFQQYQGKAGLLAASLERAQVLDADAHAALAVQVRGLIRGHASLSDFIATYVSLRAGQEVARFWSEILFKSKQIPEAAPFLKTWFEMRRAFWRDILQDLAPNHALAEIVAVYTVMEEVYAYPLNGDLQYRLLLTETARALTGSSLGVGSAKSDPASISASLDKAPLPAAPGGAGAADMREQLLNHAIGAIVEDGIGTVSQRTMTEKAAVSSSMIAYHFKDMKSFVNEAVWRALVHGIPPALDPARAAMPGTMQEWFEALEGYVRPRIGQTPAGFYTAFARITGQACLLADSRPSLMPLVSHLRALEGWGTFRVARNLGSAEHLCGRDHAAAFGMWIKAEAVLREAELRAPIDHAGEISQVAHRIFAA